jgi:carbohydrate esterase-like sialic acid-specific acetylesterase
MRRRINPGNLWPLSGRAMVSVGGLVALAAVCAYLFFHDLWPDSQLQDTGSVAPDVAVYDAFGRLVGYPGKTETPCPPRTARTAVILAIGQSNIANHAAARVATRYPKDVVSWFDGKCHVAASPLLGASGDGGEFLTLLADRLIKHDVYRSVIIVPFGIGGTQIAPWQRHGPLNDMLLRTLRDLPPGYRVTQAIWQQGESDFLLATPPGDYIASFRSLVDVLTENGVDAPLYLSISTKCGPWTADNPIAAAQRSLIDDRRVFLGVDSDALLAPKDRFDDCHLSESGQRRTAAAYADAIRRTRRLP